MIEKAAFDILVELHPSVVGVIQQLLDIKQSPSQIAKKYSDRDVFLAAIVEMAATHMLERTSK